MNESGLYEMIFRSDKEIAKQFRKWVFNEVLSKAYVPLFFPNSHIKL